MFSNMFGFIKTLHADKTEIKVILRLSSAFLIAFVLYLLANYFIIQSYSMNQVKRYLKATAISISEDFEYENGVWNTDKYLSDITTPTEIPYYIFSLDGFLIDRMNFVGGFLDTSNFVYASSFSIPQTIISPIGEHWRVLSYSIKRNGQEKGVIILGFLEPVGRLEKELDHLLLANAKRIDSKIIVSGDVFDVTHIIDNEIDHNVSFEVIDTFNRSHKSIGGPPAYIDKSYIRDILIKNDFWIISDIKTHKKYMFYSNPIRDNGETVGITIVGKDLDQFTQILYIQLLLSFVVGLFCVFVFALFALFVYRHDIRVIIEERLVVLTKSKIIVIERIVFDAVRHAIIINGNCIIDIPSDSYQHDICTLLFKNPNKHFDTLDLSDAMGELDEQKNVKRLVYDAVEAVNVKVKRLTGVKLISHLDKKYFINPIVTSKLL